MLMDLFYTICKDGLSIPEENISYKPISQRRRRLHFHEFMLGKSLVKFCAMICHLPLTDDAIPLQYIDVHQRIHNYKTIHPKADPIPPVAASIAIESRLLCFDEMQITDIADAMIIKRLFAILLDLGVVIVTTSNRPPCGLYEGGINRSIFMPFIDTLNERMIVIEMDGDHDYRRDESLLNDDDEGTTSLDSSLPTHVCTSTNSPSAVNDMLQQWFDQGNDKGQESKSEVIPVAMGRSIQVNKSNDTCGWFTFNELCKQPLGVADYLAIANRYKVIIVENVPQLDGQVYNEARRFVTLIDALYEARTKLVISSNVSIQDLFIGFDATVETHDGDEEIAIDDNNTNDTSTNSKKSSIIGEGGSSSSHSTTLIHTKEHGKVEWSGTGRIGVSLAQLSAVREVSFSFKRAASRMAEMSSSNWGGREG